MAETVRIEIPIETIDNTEPELSSVTKNFERMEKAAEGANNAAKKANSTVTQFDKQAQKTEKSLTSWAKEKVEIMLEAKDRITPILSTLKNGLGSFAGKTWSVTMQAVDLITSPVRGIINLLKNPVFQVGAVLGVSIGLKDTIDTYKDFEAAMSQVQAISGATGSEVTKLTNKAKEMGATTKFTAEESAEAFNYMAMAGWKTGDMLGGIEGILSLAAASGEDLATTSDIVTDALTAFNMTASDAGRFSDVLAAAASNANTNVSGMGETFKYAGSMAGSLGYSIEDVALMTGLMANAGIKGTMAGTALNAIFTRLSTNTSGAADAISDLGIEFFTSEGQARDLSDVMGELRKATANMTAEQKSNLANTVAGTSAQKGLLAVLNASAEDYDKLATAIENADGAAARMSDTMMDNLQGSITLLQSAVDGVKISFGERLSPYVRSLADLLADQMPEVEQGLDDLMDWIDTKVDRAKRKFAEIADTKEWQNTDFLGKAHIAWDEFIAEPFSEWWSSTGKAKFAEYAQDIGEGIGTGLKIGVMTLLGIDIGETVDEGVSIGASFAKGFSDGFDFNAVSEKLWQGFKNLLSSAGKLLPGGEAADLSSILSAVMLSKIASPFISMGKGASSIGKVLFGQNPATGSSLVGSIIGTTGNQMVQGTGLLNVLANAGYSLTGGSATAGGYFGAGTAMSGGAAAAVGAAGITGGAVAGATLISSALDAYKAFKSENKEESKAYGESAAWKAGGVAAGAAAGAAIGSIIPGLGTAVGALVGSGIGGIAGWIKGNKVKEEYQKNIEEMQKEAEKAQKVFEATGFLVSDTTFETEALNDAINDTEVSAAQLGAMFQEAVGNNLKSHFGDVRLSLSEIKEAAQSIVFDEQAKGVEAFANAVKTSESSLSNLDSTLQGIDKMNWRASLGFSLSENDLDNFKSAMDSLITDAKTYIENKHYEAALAVDLLVGSENSGNLTGGLDTMYGGLQSQIDEAGAELQRVVSEALADGVISTEDRITVNIGGVEYELDEATAVSNLQNRIAEITEKVSNAQNEARLEALKIRYGGAELDAETFSRLQEELQASVDEMTGNLDNALEVSLTNIGLQLSEGVIEQGQYDEIKAQIEEGYNRQIEDLQLRVESFQLEAIADSYGSALDEILPDIEGTTSEKLAEAMKNALSFEPEPAEWTVDQISSWFGLESLGAETQTAIAELLQATAETIPKSMIESVSSAMSDTDYSRMGDMIQMGLTTALQGMEYAGVGTAVASGAGLAIMNADMSEINSAVDTLKDNTDTAIDSAFGAGVSTTMPVDVTLDYRVVNPTKTFTLSGNGVEGSTTVSVSAHAAGGYVSGGPQLSWLAEEGYGEFVIPTNPSRRARALDLYEQAGTALGISAHAGGGYVGSSILSDMASNYHLSNDINRNAPLAYNETTEDSYDRGLVPTHESASAGMAGSAEDATIQVKVSMSPEFVIHSSEGQSEESIMQVIKRHLNEMADELGGEIARNLEAVFSNMPLKEA